MSMEGHELLEHYESTGEEGYFLEAKPLYEQALAVASDPQLLLEYGYLLECHSCRGDVKAGMGDPDGALADWRRALELDTNDIGPLYSGAFLLEREGRLEGAAEAWRSIIDWNESRGFTLQAQWPKRELERLTGRVTGT